MLYRKWMVRTFQTVLAGAVAGYLLWPVAAQASELRLDSTSVRFSDLDGSASDLDGAVNGSLTLERLELGGNAEIVVDLAVAAFKVTGDVDLSGTSAIRPAVGVQAQGPQIEVQARNIRLLGRSGVRADGIAAGGSLRLCATGKIEVGGNAEISASALDSRGRGGSVHLEAGQQLALQDAAAAVRANGGSGGSIVLLSCASDAPGRTLQDAAIYVHGRVEAIGANESGGSVVVQARQGGIAFQSGSSDVDARGAAGGGSVSITAATSVTPQEPSTQPAATVVTGSLSSTPCDCSGGGGIGHGPLVIAVDVDRTTGLPGTVFELSGRVVQSTSPVQQWEWKLSDGRELTGRTVSVSFSRPGLYGVQLTATDQKGKVVSNESGLVVFDPNTQAPPELGLPARVGDVDGDGLITLTDAHRVAKHAGELDLLAEAARPAADIDLDGKVTPGDAVLLGQAVAAGEALPTALLPDHGAPGARVNLISPELLDPLANITLEVGNSAWVQQPLRPARGYATFVLPLDPTLRGSIQVTPGPVEVRILRDGVVVQRLTFTVEMPAPLPSDPKTELRVLLDDYVALFELSREAIVPLLDLANVDGEEKELLLVAFTVAQEDVAANMAQLSVLLNEPGGEELAKLFFLYANANGYPGYRQELTEFMANEAAALRASVEALNAGGSVDQILAALCRAKKALDLLKKGGDFVSFTCDALFAAAVIAVAVPNDGPLGDAALLLTWAARCAAGESTLDLALKVGELLSSVDADLRFEASPTSPQRGQSVRLKAEIKLVGLDALCRYTAGKTRDEFIGDLAEDAVEALVRRKVALRSILKVLEKLSDGVVDQLEDRLEAGAARVVSYTGIGAALDELADKVCELAPGSQALVDDLSRIMRGPDPNVGTVTFAGDGTAEYKCPESGSTVDRVTFTATRQVCDKQQSKTVTVTCKSRQVTITIGDNGTLNDDIFEVRIAGRTVLTSSSPVRSISTNVTLAAGDHVVEMIGRAAPDGVGTYFISFSGATVIGGAPLSGTDLTPGVVKTFLIRVQ